MHTSTIVCDRDELSEILAADHCSDLAIAGVIDLEKNIIMVWRGDFTSIAIPLAAFPQNGKMQPNFSDFMITDYGQTLKFGDYEAAFDAILCEHVPVAQLDRAKLS